MHFFLYSLFRWFFKAFWDFLHKIPKANVEAGVEVRFLTPCNILETVEIMMHSDSEAGLEKHVLFNQPLYRSRG